MKRYCVWRLLGPASLATVVALGVTARPVRADRQGPAQRSSVAHEPGTLGRIPPVRSVAGKRAFRGGNARQRFYGSRRFASCCRRCG